MLGYALLVLGILVCAVTFGGWVWLNAYGCGTGCNDFRLRWEDTEALAVFIPPFIAGFVFALAGAATILANCRK
ncbi:hypothetical protein QEZ47_24585 [Aminobacter anthyllidis]|uniref:hypothetical protein n=1 Tax=Aminobacter anthyllidis TaxID=1035067 RepID=UPI002453E326|nr:hypothetical protein [Aminobacter anthyllidis]MDH4988636.1 hypothetical protein [Aminobacter anthyllidis]